MARDELYSGPVSESVPSSITGFAHRRSRADSTASYTYFQQEEEEEQPTEWLEEEAISDQSEAEDDDARKQNGDDPNLESALTPPPRRKSSNFSRTSTEDPLLRRHDSAKSTASGMGRGGRVSQKFHIVTEDLTVVVAGFATNLLGFFVYLVLCVLTFGLGYLVFRWLPRWRVRLTGTPKPLRECTWVVIEVSLSLILTATSVKLANVTRINGANSLCRR